MTGAHPLAAHHLPVSIVQTSETNFLPSSTCTANAYPNNHERRPADEVGRGKRIGLHAVSTLGFAPAILLRLQLLIVPVASLVLSGGR
jgi:hypothetical protein